MINLMKNLVLQSFAGIRLADGVQWALSPGDEISYLELVLQAIILLAGLIAASFIVFGAYTLITAGGEPETIAKGQKMITNAVIGLVIAAIAFLIVNFVIEFLPEVPGV